MLTHFPKDFVQHLKRTVTHHKYLVDLKAKFRSKFGMSMTRVAEGTGKFYFVRYCNFRPHDQERSHPCSAFVGYIHPITWFYQQCFLYGYDRGGLVSWQEISEEEYMLGTSIEEMSTEVLNEYREQWEEEKNKTTKGFSE